MNFFYNYILFLIKFITVMLSIVTTFFFISKIFTKKKNGTIKITLLEKYFEEIKNNILLSTMTISEKKLWEKLEKKKLKEKNNQEKINNKRNNNIIFHKPKLYILDFKGSVNANEVSNLSKEISAIISVFKKNDEVLLRLESAGGTVHGYGLAAAQLQRLKKEKIYLTIVVDKVAASGGYMMASVADHIVAAPFSIIGSIGVIVQFPNFNKILKKNNIDYELHTAGSNKRNLTIFGENNQEGRKNMCKKLEITHKLFKNFVHDMRPKLDINNVSDGDYWFGLLALEKGLIDSINTSDDIIFLKKNNFQLIHIKYIKYKKKYNFLSKNIFNYIYKIYKNML